MGLTSHEVYDLHGLELKGFKVYAPHNLGICTTSRLYCAFSESGNCAPILRLHKMFAQSRDCTLGLGLGLGLLSMGIDISTCFFAFLEVEYDRPSLHTSENLFT